MRYIEVTAPFDAVEKSLCCIFRRWSISDNTDHGVCAKELKQRVVEGGELNELEI